jgi:hypothetical protein
MLDPMDSHRFEHAEGPAPGDALVDRRRMLAAVKFMGLTRPPELEEPEITWRDKIRSLLFRA